MDSLDDAYRNCAPAQSNVRYPKVGQLVKATLDEIERTFDGLTAVTTPEEFAQIVQDNQISEKIRGLRDFELITQEQVDGYELILNALKREISRRPKKRA